MVRVPTSCAYCCYCAFLRLEIIIVIGEGEGVGLGDLCLVSLDLVHVKLDLRRSKGRGLDEAALRVIGELLGNVEEWSFEVVVALGGDIVVLQVLSAVEDNMFRLDLALFAVDLVTAQNNRDSFTGTEDILVPDRHVLVSDTRSHIEHKNTSLTANVVTITKTSEFLLAGGIPTAEDDGTKVGGEVERMDLDTDGRQIFLLEFTGLMTLHESGLSDTTISDKDNFKLRSRLRARVEKLKVRLC